MDLIKNIIIESRPIQWIKNLSVFTFLIFSRQFFVLHQFLEVFYTFLAFILLTSSVYIINDIVDYENDRVHPEKKDRPIASGKLSKRMGIFFSFVFFTAGLIISFKLAATLFTLYIFYFVLIVGYTFYLKNLAIIDVLVIAGGFVLRVMAGAFVIGASEIYSWIIIVTISLSLLLGFGKRRSELTILGEKSKHLRKVLFKYPANLLDSLLSALVATTFLSYVLFTFQTDLTKLSDAVLISSIPFPSVIVKVVNSSHLLKLTIPLVFYGIARYLYIIYKKRTSGTPERALFQDKPLLITVVIWCIMVFALLYI